MYVYVCIIRMQICMYVSMFVYTYVCMHACMHACMDVLSMDVYTYVCMFACIYVCVHTHIHTHTHTHKHTHTRTHTHTHTHTHRKASPHSLTKLTQTCNFPVQNATTPPSALMLPGLLSQRQHLSDISLCFLFYTEKLWTRATGGAKGVPMP
jgi:hypothetical protein